MCRSVVMPHSIFERGILIVFLSLGYAQGVSAGFRGEVIVAWQTSNESPDREMKLVEEFGFTDHAGVVWDVPAGSVVDGASIPSFFWTTIGSPFVGDYRRASVIHDHYCVTKSRSWKEVHRMFYEVSLAGGVSDIKAKVMYAAVYSKGPRWPTPGVLGAKVTPLPDISKEELNILSSWVEAENPSIREIEQRIREY